MVVLILAVLVVALLLLVVFSFQNQGTEHLAFLAFSWTHVPVWIPPALTGAGVLVLLLLVLLVSSTRQRIRRRGLSRQLEERDAELARLREDNDRLRAGQTVAPGTGTGPPPR